MAPAPASENVAPSPSRNTKRPAASLLPAFEPLSSSPSLPRPLKRSHDVFEENAMYPTPVPTSSTAIQSSSPQRFPTARPGSNRTSSALSERAPLAALATIELKADGKPLRMGRSSASCDYQLSANRLISRVHVEACYRPATSRLERDRIEIKCVGHNGVKIHCQGRLYELCKEQTFTSDARGVELMLDVHDTRVLVQWPPKLRLGPVSSDEEEEENLPAKRPRSMRRHSTPPSPSPLHARKGLVSPVSPSPAVQATALPSSPLHPNRLAREPVEIYEDPVADEDVVSETEAVTQSTQVLSQVTPGILAGSQNSSLSSAQDFSDNDEENDPIIHSFGPFGANLLPRMASFTHGDSHHVDFSPKSSRSSHTLPLQTTVSPSQPANRSSEFDVRGHVINQLAFSRLSSTPLSTILSHLPEEAGVPSTSELMTIINQTGCIGEVSREGKDAAGKPLESEYYYIPAEDEDEKRKEAVVHDLMKPGLRSCRKQHKQYFWRKPKKP